MELPKLSSVSDRFSEMKKVALSVDDDAVNQLVIATCLESEDYEVAEAMDGFEALEWLSKAERMPDIMLLDVMMPGMSGFEVCAKVRELYPATLPILMISAKRARDDVLKGLACECNDYITKPFDKSELLARIQSKIKLNITLEIQRALRKTISLLKPICPPELLINDPSKPMTFPHAGVLAVVFPALTCFESAELAREGLKRVR